MPLPPDPKVRRDNRCARPGCTKKRPIAAADPKQLRELMRYAGQQAETDPFCSSRCARLYHAVDFGPEPDDARAEAISEGGQMAADRFRAGRATF